MNTKHFWQKYGIVLVSSLLSAVFAVLLYRMLDEAKPNQHDSQNQYSHYALQSDPLAEPAVHQFLSSAPTDFIEAAERVTASVIFIRTYERRGIFGSNTLTVSSGSGVIVSADGYIVTNHHVIDGGQVVEVTLHDKREFSAEVIGTDPSTDLAVLKIIGDDLPYAQLGDSDSLRVGEWVLAVGNPFNLESTVTAGIVSAKGRSIDILKGQDRIESFIQTDAVVNPGNSGGALVNTRGELIGVNTAIISRSGGYEGYSFAVPSNLVRKVVRDLRDYGLVQRGLLGVYIEPLDNTRAKELGLKRVRGVYISRINEGSGAADADLRIGDVITGINGINIKAAPEMQEQLGRYRPGDEISVQYVRRRKARETKVVLKNKGNSINILTAQEEEILKELGFELRNLTATENHELKSDGIKVVSIYLNGIIAATNMAPGFVITRVNGKNVADVTELIQELKNTKGKVVLAGRYEEYEETYYYSFQLGG